MLPLNTRPTTSPLALIAGDPEFPPMLPLVMTSPVCTLALSVAINSNQRPGRSHDALPPALPERARRRRLARQHLLYVRIAGAQLLLHPLQLRRHQRFLEPVEDGRRREQPELERRQVRLAILAQALPVRLLLLVGEAVELLGHAVQRRAQRRLLGHA